MAATLITNAALISELYNVEHHAQRKPTLENVFKLTSFHGEDPFEELYTLISL